MISIYDRETLFEEVAFVAYHFGWSREEVLTIPHWERHRWCEEISAINERMNESDDATAETDSILGGEGVIQNSLEDL
ncbi:DUF6760 family protein [Halovivax limisalsi]|uniref:DUF6760 family protein n=1 Tax=Halovivax limisalsi TaxID=1453760 RepID=UPI001FFD5782|nr:DUF6760 family protein [Halovivax limisalsi]